MCPRFQEKGALRRREMIGDCPMRTRIIQTKIWEDSYFSTLEPIEKLLFFYYITNPSITILFLYECPDKKVIFDTGVKIEDLQKAKAKFQEAGKIYFYKDFVYLANAYRYEEYSGEKNEKAKQTLIKQLKDDVYNWYLSLLPKSLSKDRGIHRGIDTLRDQDRDQDRDREQGIELVRKVLEKKGLIKTAAL